MNVNELFYEWLYKKVNFKKFSLRIVYLIIKLKRLTSVFVIIIQDICSKKPLKNINQLCKFKYTDNTIDLYIGYYYLVNETKTINTIYIIAYKQLIIKICIF